jgi:hypothetical protein
MKAPPSPAPRIDNLNREEMMEAIKEWFAANFEDPAQHTPYESAEGGYQWIWGGPYDAREEIESHFSDIPDDVLDEVVSELENEAVDWAPHERRIVPEPPEFDDDEPELSGYQALQARLDHLESLLVRVEPLSSLIGSNHPPEEIGIPPYAGEDKKEIENAIAVLRKPESDQIAESEKTEQAAEVLKTYGERFKDFCLRHGDKFFESFASQLGTRTADSMTIAFWMGVSGGLLAAYEAAKMFLAGIMY